MLGFALAGLAGQALGQSGTFDFGTSGHIVLDQLPNQELQGRVYTTDALGNPQWTYNVNGTSNGGALDLDFTHPGGSETIFGGQFEVPATIDENPFVNAPLVAVTAHGFDNTLNALALQGQLESLLADGDTSALAKAGYVTWSPEEDGPHDRDLAVFAAGFDNADIVKLLQTPDGQSALWIKPGFEDVVAVKAMSAGFGLVADVPAASERHIVLRARPGSVYPLDASVYDRQPVAQAALQRAIGFRSDRFQVTPITGMDYQVVIVGSAGDFGLGSAFQHKFYRLVFRIAVGLEPGPAPGTYEDLIRIIFERGELKVQNGADDFGEVDDSGFVNLEGTPPDRDTVPGTVGDMFAAYFIAAFQAIRQG